MKHVVVMVVLSSGVVLGCSDDGAGPGEKPPAAHLRHRWSQRFGDSAHQTPAAVGVDGSGNVTVTGFFGGTVNFGGGDLTSAGSNDIFVTSFDPDGAHRWSKRFGDANIQHVYADAVDGSGNVIVAGEFEGTVNFGGSDLTSTGLNDIYVAVFGPDGSHRWSKRLGDGSNRGAVAVDGSGNVIIAAGFGGTMNLGGADLTSAGLDDIFVALFSSDGTHLWSQRFGSGAYQTATAVTIDGAGNVIVAGFMQGIVNFGGGDLTSAGSNDIFVASFGPTGTHRWSKRFGDGNNQNDPVVAVDGSGNVIVAGGFEGTVNFGDGDLTSVSSRDVFVASLSTTGAHRWSKRFGDGAATAAAVDGSGNVIVAGYFGATVNFGGGVLIGAGATDVFVASLGPTGTHRWSKRFGDISEQIATAAAVDGLGNVIVTGYFDSTVNFGGADLTSAGPFRDTFLAKFEQSVSPP